MLENHKSLKNGRLENDAVNNILSCTCRLLQERLPYRVEEGTTACPNHFEKQREDLIFSSLLSLSKEFFPLIDGCSTERCRR